MENEVPSGKPTQGVTEEFEINMEFAMGIEGESFDSNIDSSHEPSPSGGYGLVSYVMRGRP